METDDLMLQCKKEAKKQITFHKKEAKRWEGVLYTLHKKELKPNIMNDFNFLYFSDKILTNDKTKRVGFWLRSQEAIKIMNDLEELYNIASLFPRKNNKEEPLMFAGLYISYAKWIGEDAEKIAKLEVWEALRKHCIDFEMGQLTFGDIATIMGVIY
jgi:hypothetical protein